MSTLNRSYLPFHEGRSRVSEWQGVNNTPSLTKSFFFSLSHFKLCGYFTHFLLWSSKKRDFRRLWIQRINAGARQHGLVYSQFINGIKLASIDIDRKNLAELAVNQPEAFAKIAEKAKAALEKAQKAA